MEKQLKKAMAIGSFAVLFGASSAMAQPVAAMPNEEGKTFAAEAMKSGDWSSAEEDLMGNGESVFAKLNLASVYAQTGRTDKAVALYQEIINGDENPYAVLLNGKPRRVKNIAKFALAQLSTN
ncbi:hypothetical protein [Pseudokordiimonas caeni]|uniref:hypothetical protein n=1 Tax=Pseudokordiimonas caeni TaxID=2997908 RepID=UPI0028110DEE|nr:hypothetical protein [Pseudokordiimonas caeni]